MKFFVLSLFIVNLLSTFKVVYGVLSGDCIQLNTFLKRDKNTECCVKNEVCDAEGNIIELTMDSKEFSNIHDYTRFPIFNKLVKLSGGVPNINNNMLPTRFFDQPKLDILELYESNISFIPSNINSNCPVTEINLEHNDLTEFPSQLSALPNLQHLYLWDNKISGTVDLQNFKALNQIDVGKNQIDDMINISSNIQTLFMFENPISKIPDEVPSLTDLTEFDFSKTQITEIPPNLFKLKKLNKFNIANNPQLSTSVINFGSTNIKECTFENTNIICYQSNTCASVNSNSYSECSEDQINEILSQQTEIKDIATTQSTNRSTGNSGNSEDSNNSTMFIAIGCIAAILILAVVGFLYVSRKKNNNENDDNNDDKKYDIIVTEKIKKIKVYEDGQENNNNSNSNNNNNNNNNNNSNDISNSNNNDNSNSNSNDVGSNNETSINNQIRNSFISNPPINPNLSQDISNMSTTIINDTNINNYDNRLSYISANSSIIRNNGSIVSNQNQSNNINYSNENINSTTELPSGMDISNINNNNNNNINNNNNSNNLNNSMILNNNNVNNDNLNNNLNYNNIAYLNSMMNQNNYYPSTTGMMPIQAMMNSPNNYNLYIGRMNNNNVAIPVVSNYQTPYGIASTTCAASPISSSSNISPIITTTHSQSSMPVLILPNPNNGMNNSIQNRNSINSNHSSHSNSNNINNNISNNNVNMNNNINNNISNNIVNMNNNINNNIDNGLNANNLNDINDNNINTNLNKNAMEILPSYSFVNNNMHNIIIPKDIKTPSN